MLQNSWKTLGFKKNMVYKIPPGGGGKPYPASGLQGWNSQNACQDSKQEDPDQTASVLVSACVVLHVTLHFLYKYHSLMGQE